MPTPTPSPSPVPTIAVVPTQDVAQDLVQFLGLESVRHARLLVIALEAALLFGSYFLARWLLNRLLRRFEQKLAAREPERVARLRTMAGMLASLFHFALAFVFLVSGLSIVGVNVAALLGTASVVGLAVGFGAQKLVKDVITGFFLLLEDQYAVGDYVTIGGVSGSVVDLGMRTTQIRDDDGRQFTISNGDIGTVCNHSRGPIQSNLDIALSASADLDAATVALNTAFASEFESLGLTSAPKVEGVAGIEAAKTTLRIGFSVPAGQRPAPYALKLRDLARKTLISAQVPLG